MGVEKSFIWDREFNNVVKKAVPARLHMAMKESLPDLIEFYRGLVGDCSAPHSLLNFWRDNQLKLPAPCVEVARIFALLQPSSAAAERGCSVWRNRIDNDQFNSLEPKQALTVKVGYKMRDLRHD